MPPLHRQGRAQLHPCCSCHSHTHCLGDGMALKPVKSGAGPPIQKFLSIATTASALHSTQKTAPKKLSPKEHCEVLQGCLARKGSHYGNNPLVPVRSSPIALAPLQGHQQKGRRIMHNLQSQTLGDQSTATDRMCQPTNIWHKQPTLVPPLRGTGDLKVNLEPGQPRPSASGKQTGLTGRRSTVSGSS